MVEKNSPERMALKWAIGFVVLAILLIIYELLFPSSSTSCLIIIAVPFIIVFVGIFGFLVSWSVIIIHRLLFSSHRFEVSNLKKIISLATALFILIVVSIFIFHQVMNSLLLSEARSPSTSQERLTQIYRHSLETKNVHNFSMTHRLARNKNLSRQIIEELYAQKEYRFDLALNPATPLDILQKLVEDKDKYVRTWVTRNPNATKEMLDKLKTDEDPSVRSYAETALKYRGFNNE